jgi:hypothetical protein
LLRPRQQFGKYRIQKRIGYGGFATVYKALDTVEGTWVALKVPRSELMRPSVLGDFRREVQITAKLDHPNILPIKNADFIEGRFVIVYPLGEKTLTDRMQHRVSTRTAMDYASQMLEALAYAHSRRVIHCDVKPENFIIFPGERVRLADFGIAKVSVKTLMSASGSGTVGYVAPEQAMGKPSFRSDCFSLGLILYRMLAGRLPRWPYAWPPPGYDNLRRKVPREMVDLLRKAIEVDERKRYQNARQMLAAFQRVRPRVLAQVTRRGRNRNSERDWRVIRMRQFKRTYGRSLDLRYSCKKCDGPVAETMFVCPWCGASRRVLREETRFPHRCRRCHRGMKLDWTYCPWCYGPRQGPQTSRSYSDVRYAARCSGCRGKLMPYMRYCPWCHRRVQRKWKIQSSKHVCPGCGWSVVPEFWRRCPWCARRLPRGV